VGHGSERDGQSQILLASLPPHLAGEREGAQNRRVPPRVDAVVRAVELRAVLLGNQLLQAGCRLASGQDTQKGDGSVAVPVR
jgi:hypothetical protein